MRAALFRIYLGEKNLPTSPRRSWRQNVMNNPPRSIQRRFLVSATVFFWSSHSNDRPLFVNLGGKLNTIIYASRGLSERFGPVPCSVRGWWIVHPPAGNGHAT